MKPKNEVKLALNELIEKTDPKKNIYKPIFFNLSEFNQKDIFFNLIQSNPSLEIHDHIEAQVEELIKCLNPSIIFAPPIVLLEAVEKQFADRPKEEYGVWVYYPWANKAVHLLAEKEFAIVRTNRNKYKITADEQNKLSEKKIGVIGLSVGQSVSLTLAMERSFNELRIADFDELDLSNINRIRTGVFNLKIKKTVIVAREIAEIDPFLNVVCYEDGITNENIDDFLNGNGKLDLLIDECDSFDIKISAREKAKALGIPVLMEGSDRGTIDIERFDLEPERAILHGMTDHLDMSNYKNLSTLDERVPYITAVTGVETLSPRMKASAIEIMGTISTWPQLASAVTFGGGLTTDVARKILLNQLSVSGRFFVDLDELITNEKTEEKIENSPKVIDLIQTETIEKYIAAQSKNFPKTDFSIPNDTLTTLIEAAAKAPSGGNSQPWRWHYQNGILHLFLETDAAQAYLDPQQISAYVSLGSAIENLLLSAANIGLKVNWQLTPQLAPKHLAWFYFEPNHSSTPSEKQLAAQINLRHTNRKIASTHQIEICNLNELSTLVEKVDGAKLTWITEKDKIQSIATIATQTDLLRMFIPEAHEDFINREMRWNMDEVNQTEDGIGIHTLDLNNNDQIGIRLLKDKKAVNFLQQINGGSGFKRLTMQQFMSSAAIGLISMPHKNITGYVNGGIAAQKMWLGATALNLQIHPVNVPLIFFFKNSIENSLPIPEENKTQLKQAEHTFNQIFDLKEHEQPIFMFRIFKAISSPERTIRKPLSKILSIGRA